MNIGHIPICIPSYRRSLTSKTLNLLRRNRIFEDVFVFVREEELNSYLSNFGEFTYVPIAGVKGLAGTRQIIFDFCKERYEYYIDMDDDITSVQYRPDYSSTVIKRDVARAIALMKEEIRYFFTTYKETALIGAIRQHFQNTKEGRFYLNCGSTPRQMYGVNVRLLADCGIKRNAAFDLSGDDIGFVAECAMKQLDFANALSVCYEFEDDKKNSVVRNASNWRIKHEIQSSLLESYGLLDVFRKTRPRKAGDPVFFDIDYQKYTRRFNRPSMKIDA